MRASTGATAGGYTVPLAAGSADANKEVFLGLMSGYRWKACCEGWEDGCV